MSAFVSTKKKMDVTTIAKVSILGAFACILMLLEFPLPIAPTFYQMDFSEVVVLIGGFALGPWAAVAIEGLKVLLNLLINGTITMGIGDLANFLVGCAFVLPAVILYQKHKTKKRALLGLLLGTLCMTLLAMVINYVILIPAYVYFMQPALTMDIVISMGQAIFPSIDGLLSLILLCVVPFNIIKGVLVSAIVFITYKRIAPLLKR